MSLKFSKISCLSIVLLMVLSVFTSSNNYSHRAIADSYDDQISVIQSKIDASNAVIADLKAKQDSLQNKLAILDEQIKITQQALEKTKQEMSQVTDQIALLQAKLDKTRAALANNMKLLYQEGELGALELLFSSDNLSEDVKRQEYLTSIKTKVEDSVKEVVALKDELEIKRSELDKLQISQQAQIENIALQQNEQKQLLEQTKGQEEQYQNLVKADKASISNLKSQQAAAIAAVSSKRSSTGSVVGGGGTGGYPWANLVQDSGADPWGFYYRECTSYAAWKRSQIGKEIPAWGTMGPADAKYWVSWALKFGYSVDQSPQVGDIGVYQGGSYGHVMIVEKVLDGGKVLVSEYNAGFNGMYSTSEWSISSLQFIH